GEWWRMGGGPGGGQEFASTTLPRISPDYFRAVGVPLVRGRFFSQGDSAESQPVVIISASLARRYFPHTDPIGQKIQASQPSGNTSPFMDIVGVVGDVRYWGMKIAAKPAYYVPFTQNLSPTSFLVVRSSNPAATLAPMIRREIHALDKDAVV